MFLSEQDGINEQRGIYFAFLNEQAENLQAGHSA